MPRKSSPIRQHSIAFESLGSGSDNAGGSYSNWVEQFQCRAGYRHLKGGESVIAARLEGKHVQIVNVGYFQNSRSVTTDWRIKDLRTNETYNVRDISISEDRSEIDFLCESGVASG